jgi:hypothetical protein
MNLKKLIPEAQYTDLQSLVKFLYYSEKYPEVCFHIAATLRFNFDYKRNHSQALKESNEVLCDSGNWDEAKLPISNLIKTFFVDTLIPSEVTKRGRPYNLVDQSTERYMHWSDY